MKPLPQVVGEGIFPGQQQPFSPLDATKLTGKTHLHADSPRRPSLARIAHPTRKLLLLSQLFLLCDGLVRCQ